MNRAGLAAALAAVVVSGAPLAAQGPPAFRWQAGYGALSVSSSSLAKVKAYIHNQAEHHRTQSFQEEFRAFLRRHQVPFDERYVWD